MNGICPYQTAPLVKSGSALLVNIHDSNYPKTKDQYCSMGQSYYPRTQKDTPGHPTIPKRQQKIHLFVHF